MQRVIYRLLCFCLLLGSFNSAKAIDEKYAAPALQGSQLTAANASSMVMDTVYFNPALKPLQTTWFVKNLITFQLDESYRHMLPDEFNVSVTFKIHYTQDVNGAPVTAESDPITLGIEYSKYTSYKNKAVYVGADWYKVEVEIITVNGSGTLGDYLDALVLTNEILVNREYSFSCTNNTIRQIFANNTPVASRGELNVYWTPERAADEYDLEWAYIDDLAKANYYRSTTDTTFDPKKVFANNATRVSITREGYNIPLLYEASGRLFFRVRAVQVKRDGQRMESLWSSDYTGGLGQYGFVGLDSSLNWQASTSFAEEGKRKSVVQYFDGSLKSRQTVTKDNTTDTTIIAETFYDYQGRPVIQVMPTPSLRSIINFTPNFNRLNSASEYSKSLYDSITAANCYCNVGAPAMDSTQGAAQYYSPNNPLKTNGYHKYIPNANGYVFAETRYTPDNTGRVSIQSGVGETFQIGKGHETKYTYSGADQEELDALFGTEVGNKEHYFKNTVRDANGQVSVSYVDMHGRTIATALADLPTVSMDPLPSNNSNYILKKLIDSNSNVIKGTVIESSNGLEVTSSGNHRFMYSMLPDSIGINGCDNKRVCYDCIYDLRITITDECNNTTWTNGPVVINRTNGPADTVCGSIRPLPVVDTIVFLPKGSYLVTKTLTVNQQAMEYYRDSVFLVRNTCLTLEQTIQEQKTILASLIQCEPSCATCTAALGDWETFRNNYMQQAGIPNSDTAAYRQQAAIAYKQEQDECQQLCDGIIPLHVSIRQQMLADVTPPYGQYANPDKIDIYSIFWKPDAGEPEYTYTGIYKDENGKDESPDPRSMSQDDFVASFKDPWAETLLPMHPEYAKLVQYEKYAASNTWDQQFGKTETFQEAVTKGYLNPGNFTSHPAGSNFSYNANYRDPFFTDYIPGIVASVSKDRMQDSLLTAMHDAGNNPVSMWSMATILAHCGAGDAACMDRNKSMDSAFAISGCSGELDMAWKYFREMYLQKKRELVGGILRAVQFQSASQPYRNLAPLVAANHHLNFYDPYLMPTGDMPTSEQAVKDSIQTYINDNCVAYVNQWWQDLGPCGYNSTDSAWIIPKLIAVCREGGDVDHFFGASTVKPSSTYQYKSFEDVLKAYSATNPNPARPYNAACNVYLISAPLPYDQQPVFTNKPVFQKPDSCECANISSLYLQYKAAKKDSSFADYLYRTTQTVVSNGTLDTLRMACNGQISCNFLQAPVFLPPVLQCGVKDVCVSCSKIGTLYNKYLDQFPNSTPATDNGDSLQTEKNKLFERFMNTNLGFGKSTAEYLDFMKDCNILHGGACTDSLGYILDQFNALYKSNSMYTPGGQYKGDTTDYYLDPKLSWIETVQNGIFTFPARVQSNPGAFDLYYQKPLQVPTNGLTIEVKFKLPLLDSNCVQPDFQIQLRPDMGRVNALFYTKSIPCGKTYGAFDLTDSIGRVITALNAMAIDMRDWVKMKMAILKNKYQIWVADTLLLEVPYTGTITKLNSFGLFFGTRTTSTKSVPAVDYIKVYNGCNDLVMNQEFDSINAKVCPDLSVRVAPDDYKTVFTSYYNQYRSTNYTVAQIDSIYNSCSNLKFNTCNEPNLVLCGKSEPVITSDAWKPRTACDDSTLFATSTGVLLNEAYRDSLFGSFNDRYLAKCLNARYNESFTVYQPVSEYHYTLYYYDQAGNLLKTVPPEGVDVSKFAYARAWSDSVTIARRNKKLLTPNHKLPTQYRYNTLNQVMAQQSPDGGLSNFWYDRLGRLVISQNAKQRAAATTPPSGGDGGGLYSYTKYDSLGRITEVGQVSNTNANGAMSKTVSRNQPLLNNWLLALNNRRGQITNTVYDLPYDGFVGIGDPRMVITQRNLRNRVSYTTLTDTGAVTAHSAGTFYTYDILGNVDQLLQDYGNRTYTANVMNERGNRFKKIRYEYDLISGKVNMVIYQQGYRDAFFHRYSYDAENRLTLVETSGDSLVWEKDARYDYYRHGPLARVTLGDQQVQGLDYAYTLQGWLKGINSTGGTETIDMGKDGNTGSQNQFTARDALGLTLNYFGNDYTAINGTPFPAYSAYMPTSAFKPLYNGNISSSSVYQKKFDYAGSPGGPLIFYNYQYDQLNRLTGQDAYNGFNSSSNSWSGLTNMGDHLKERIAYDANGNIKKYLRNSIDGTTAQMDSLNYYYYPGTNRLKQVTDNVPANAYVNQDIQDIDGQPDNNYKYDAIGNLIKDSAEKITGIKWNVYGKIQEIDRIATTDVPASNIKYTYDAMGNRISQVVTSGGTKYYTWYVRDAQGNILSTYTAEGANTNLADLTLKLGQRFLYGSSRLGLITVDDDNVNGGADNTEYYYQDRDFGYDRGHKQYELTNHLGNVLATISDRKFGVSSGSSSLIDYYEPHIVTAQDYYPFGMLSRVSLPGSGVAYKFGFQGEMNDDQVKGLGNQIAFDYRIHDSRVGRFLSVDPIDEQYPGVSPYAFAHNKVNFGNEQEGLEIVEGLFKYHQWFINKLNLGGTWVDDMNNSLYNRFSIEGRINQVTTAVKTEVQQIKKSPGQWYLKKIAQSDPNVGGLMRSKETVENVKRVGSGIIHGNTDAIAEGIDMGVQVYMGYKSGGLKPQSHIDIGGFGRWSKARNFINTPVDYAGKPIPNLTLGWAQQTLKSVKAASVDLVTIENTSFAPDVLSEATRVLKPNGTLRILTNAEYYPPKTFAEIASRYNLKLENILQVTAKDEYGEPFKQYHAIFTKPK